MASFCSVGYIYGQILFQCRILVILHFSEIVHCTITITGVVNCKKGKGKSFTENSFNLVMIS